MLDRAEADRMYARDQAWKSALKTKQRQDDAALHDVIKKDLGVLVPAAADAAPSVTDTTPV